MRILITGASGFAGYSFYQYISQRYPDVFLSVCSRRPIVNIVDNPRHDHFICDLSTVSSGPEWRAAFKNVDFVFHFAGLAHKPRCRPLDHWIHNCNYAIELAYAASRSGVKAFYLISSISVFGKSSFYPLSPFSPECPHDSYSWAKYQAEIGLKKICDACDMQYIIVRPPMIYGRNAPGNFPALVKLVRSQLPLPFASVANSRSFLSIYNFMDFLDAILWSPAARNQTLLVSDPKPVSTPEFITQIGTALSLPVNLCQFSPRLMRAAAFCVGQGKRLSSLLDSLEVSNDFNDHLLGWSPHLSTEESLVKSFLEPC